MSMEQDDLEYQEPRYYIDRTWYERQNRSFVTFAASRMCANCQAKLGTEVEERVAVQQGGKVIFEKQRVPYGHNPFQVIRDCCSQSKGYMTPNLPLQEAIFRVMLVGNQPMTVEELKQKLDDWFEMIGRRRAPDLATLKRLLEHDQYYGIRKIQVPVARVA